MAVSSRFEPSAVFNQSPPYQDIDLFMSDRPLCEAVAANGAAADGEVLSAFGRAWGTADLLVEGRLANINPPILEVSDSGRGDDRVVTFDPAYHRFMARGIADGLHASTWKEDGTHAAAPAEVVRAARLYMASQIEAGHICPLTMTRASIAALAAAPALRDQMLPKLLSRSYDPHMRPWWEKTGMTIGMGMTERQGGTDVRANMTRAEPAGGDFIINGHKWFMSAPMCDAFLVLAQASGGLTSFLMPRFRPDGSVNGLHFQRLKDKLGNRSNASSEVEFVDAFAWRVGEEGKGIRTIIEMVQLTRTDCAAASAGLMRMALAQAVHHAHHRRVFQRKLIDQPMMRMVLADLALDLEGGVALIFRVTRALDHSPDDTREAAIARLLIPAAKYWVCKTAPAFIYEAMECLGGNGYVEDDVLARLYREAPVNAIWEGSGNVMCLDVLRAMTRDHDATQAALRELDQVIAPWPELKGRAMDLGATLSRGEAFARQTVEQLALLAAAGALAQSAPPMVVEAFIRSRLTGSRHATYGTAALEPSEVTQLLDRAIPSA